MSNYCFIDLRISGAGLQFDQISEKLKMHPDYIYKKDNNGCTFNQEITQREDCWITGIQISDAKSVTSELENFIESFKETQKFLKDLTKKYTVTIWLSIYTEDEQKNVHLSNKFIDFLYETKIVFDCNYTYLKDIFQNNYNLN